MDELKAIYRQALPTHIQALEAARSEPATRDPHPARRIAHTLRGSGGTYGFPEISAAAAAVEDAPARVLPARVDALIAVLQHVVAAGAELT